MLSTLQAQHPDFLRLFYMLSLERGNDPAVAEVVRRVRDTAIARFRNAITQLLPADAPPSKADRVVTELTALAVALGRTRHDPLEFFPGSPPPLRSQAACYRVACRHPC